MKTVYIVTSGAYSDYRIRAVFDNKRDAQDHVRSIRALDRDGDEADIDEWPLYHDGEHPVYVEIHRAGAKVGKDGKVLEENFDAYHEWRDPPITDRPSRVGTWSKSQPWLQVEGTDALHVQKALHDWVAEVQARIAGIA